MVKRSKKYKQLTTEQLNKSIKTSRGHSSRAKTKDRPKDARSCNQGSIIHGVICKEKGHDYQFLRFDNRYAYCPRCGDEVLM